MAIGEQIAESAAHASWVTAFATVALAVLTLGLVIGAGFAWNVARKTLQASRDAANAAKESANQQRLDSIARTRPYVHVTLALGIGGISSFDLVVQNTGRSSALEVSVHLRDALSDPDDIAKRTLAFLGDEHTLHPGQRHRIFWSIREEGMPQDAIFDVTYRDSEGRVYSGSWPVTRRFADATPAASNGHEPASGISAEFKDLHKIIGELVQAVGELRR